MLDQLNNLSCYFEAEQSFVICIYSTLFIVFLNPDFNCSKSFLSFSVDKVTTGKYNFVPVIWNFNPVGATTAGGSLLFPEALTFISAKAQFLEQVKINSISQLVNGIFKVLQKLLKCFNGATISVSFLPTLPASQPASPTPRL